MYTDRNFKSKKDLVAAFLEGAELSTYQPGGMFPAVRDGWVSIEGPHYPQPHRFYLRARVERGIIREIKGVKTPTRTHGGPGAPPEAPV